MTFFLLFVLGAIFGFVLCSIAFKTERPSRHDNVVRIDNARRYHMAKNGEL